MAVYLVEDSKGNKTLVETRTKSGAINFVSQNEYTATALNTSQLVQHIKTGMEVQTVGDDENSSEEEERPEIKNTIKRIKKETAAYSAPEEAA